MPFLFTVGFVFWRFVEIVTLAPIVGMLGYFVNGYVNANVMTPDYILILFIVSVLALAWAIFTLFSYHRSSTNARFVAFIDICFVGAFIAGVYYLRFISNADCSHIAAGSGYDIDFGIFGTYYGNRYHVDTNKTCALLKASFAFGIMECIFFFFTAILAWIHGDRMAKERTTKRYYRETHYSRRGHRRRSSHGSHRSHTSRRSSQSRRRVYV
ncbi:hypothetical protein M406DRAFT_356470 [Cryphonectria parasitica EP155]|uniref:MARVEL domain-containing protein n=1 Tax=Cryphonectria parasitica (strain ATCC 38755 / EP155) TaxID=660469 RepID=A0A9P5CMC4_CRYP1|nr:uncharacterized protein M406DRAFT_356470 [Cryphonectria parasitica EP155]KAF3764224.1 hypothetical protein M406DRAFT_356470 [Cryphonectria parasitica EP155]